MKKTTKANNLKTLKAVKESEVILANPSKYKSYYSADEMIVDILKYTYKQLIAKYLYGFIIS